MRMKMIKVTRVYREIKKSQAKTLVVYGGSRSSKSHSLCQYLIKKLVTEEYKVFGILRKTNPALKMTTYKVFIDLLKEYGYYRRNGHNKTGQTYTHKNNTIYFFSLDDPEKAKSTAFNYIWMEEANEFTLEDYTQLGIRLSAPSNGGRNQIFLSLNPVDRSCWIAKLEGKKDVEFLHSTYKDNPFLEKEYINYLEGLIGQDENYARVYLRGEWGQLGNLIYNYRLVDSLPKEFLTEGYGLDFGYINPTALVRVVDTEDGYYLEEMIHQTHLSNYELIERLKDLPKLDIYADPSRPDLIDEISGAGFLILPGNSDVIPGIERCKRKPLYVHKDSYNLITELSGYQRKKDKEGNVLEDPIKFKDHAVDAFRYGIMGVTELIDSFLKEKPQGKFVFKGIKAKVF